MSDLRLERKCNQIRLRPGGALLTEDGGMPVDAADPFVLGVLLVGEGLVEHQPFRHFTSPVVSIHRDAQQPPVVVKHVHDLSLLKSLNHTADGR